MYMCVKNLPVPNFTQIGYCSKTQGEIQKNISCECQDLISDCKKKKTPKQNLYISGPYIKCHYVIPP